MLQRNWILFLVLILNQLLAAQDFAGQSVQAQDDYAQTYEEEIVELDVIANDAGEQLSPKSLKLIEPCAKGAVQFREGRLIFSPKKDFHGDVELRYRVCNAKMDCDTALALIQVWPRNDAPSIRPDQFKTIEDQPILCDVLANDRDVDGVLMRPSIFVKTLPENGSVDVDAAGNVVYTPFKGWYGRDAFEYQVCDDRGACGWARVSLSVSSLNDLPSINSDWAYTENSGLVDIDVLQNDFDPDGDLDWSTMQIVVGAEHGMIEKLSEGVIRYQAESGFNGMDHFRYVICDAEQACDEALVSVSVGSKYKVHQAQTDQFKGDEGEELNFSVVENDKIQKDESFSVPLLSSPEHGWVMLSENGDASYQPLNDWDGRDEFQYELCDAHQFCTQAWARIQVRPKNNIPKLAPDFAICKEDESVQIDVLKNDVDPDGLIKSNTLSISRKPWAGVLTLEEGQFNYRPTADFSGTDEFHYEVCDNQGACAEARVQIDIEGSNDAPRSEADFYILNIQEPIRINPLDNDFDDFDALQISDLTWTSGPFFGTVKKRADGFIEYTPRENYWGRDSMRYQICDREGLCSQAWIRILTREIKSPAVASNHTNKDEIWAQDDFARTPVGEAVSIPVLDNDSESLLVSCLNLESPPQNGQIRIEEGGIVVYTPNQLFRGRDCFSYSVCENSVAEDARILTQTVCVEVFGENLEIPQVFTPNGDGVNDRFVIPDLDRFPNNELYVYDRNQNLVFHARSYQNDWSGQWDSRGKELPAGTYYYVLYEDSMNESSAVHKGFTTIKR
jgi:gliding motility-associated-like protein